MNIARLKSTQEIFCSLQGEGSRAGTPAVFLRLAGCNLHCSWCDTKHSWGAGLETPEEELAARIRAYDCAGLVITGGEPLLQQPALLRLLKLLPPQGELFVEVETNGTIAPLPALAARVDQWNVSPKLGHSGNAGDAAMQPQVLAQFAAMPHAWFKFVVRGEEDWPAIAALDLPQRQVMLMPCAATRDALHAARPAVAEMSLRHKVRLGDRLHLELWDDKKGV